MKIVIKIGTSSLISEHKSKTRLNLSQMATLVEACSSLMDAGHKVILVSSGAVGAGLHCLSSQSPGFGKDTSAQPEIVKSAGSYTLSQRQALAAIGQGHMMSLYESLFSALNKRCAQILLTYDTFKREENSANAKNTLVELLRIGVIPIINENDTVTTLSLRSENDSMAVMVGSLVQADYIFLLTDVDGVYTSNPNNDPNAKLIPRISDINSFLEDQEIRTEANKNAGISLGTGGMGAKINAAVLATSLGMDITIMAAKSVQRIAAEIDSEKGVTSGTRFLKSRDYQPERKRWIRALRTQGTIALDSGAVKGLKKRQNIYAVGITRVDGVFQKMAAVKIVDDNGIQVGAGLSNFDSREIDAMKKMRSSDIIDKGIAESGMVIDRKNLAVDFSRDLALDK